MIPRTHRISGAHLRRTLPRSRSHPSDWGIIRYNPDGDTVRIACIVSKKVAKSSPDRHRIKRRIYAIAHPALASLRPGYYYLFPNKSVLTTSHEILSKQFALSLDHFQTKL